MKTIVYIGTWIVFFLGLWGLGAVFALIYGAIASIILKIILVLFAFTVIVAYLIIFTTFYFVVLRPSL